MTSGDRPEMVLSANTGKGSVASVSRARKWIYGAAIVVLLGLGGAYFVLHRPVWDQRARAELSREIDQEMDAALLRARKRWPYEGRDIGPAMELAGKSLTRFRSIRAPDDFNIHFTDWEWFHPSPEVVVFPSDGPLDSLIRSFLGQDSDAVEAIGRELKFDESLVPRLSQERKPETPDAWPSIVSVGRALHAQACASVDDENLDGASLAIRRLVVLERIQRREALHHGSPIQVSASLRRAWRGVLHRCSLLPDAQPRHLKEWRDWLDAVLATEPPDGGILIPERWRSYLSHRILDDQGDVHDPLRRLPVQRGMDILLAKRVDPDIRRAESERVPVAAAVAARDLWKAIEAAWDARDGAALAPGGELHARAYSGAIGGYSPAALDVTPDSALRAWREDAALLLLRVHLRLRIHEVEGKGRITEANLPADLPVDPWTGQRPDIVPRPDGWFLSAGPSGIVEFEGKRLIWSPESLHYVRPAMSETR